MLAAACTHGCQGHATAVFQETCAKTKPVLCRAGRWSRICLAVLQSKNCGDSVSTSCCKLTWVVRMSGVRAIALKARRVLKTSTFLWGF